jgi:hypothetical protein
MVRITATTSIFSRVNSQMMPRGSIGGILRIHVFSFLIIDEINRKSVGARVLIIGVMPHIISPSILEEARLMAIDHFKEQDIVVKFDLQLIISPHFCSLIHGLTYDQLALMDNTAMQSQGTLLSGMDHFQR